MGYLHAESLSVRSPLEMLEITRPHVNLGLKAPDQLDPLIFVKHSVPGAVNGGDFRPAPCRLPYAGRAVSSCA